MEAQAELLWVEALKKVAATSMAGLPICNEALEVATVGFVNWHGYRIGVMITPWAINLMLVSGAELPKALVADEKETHAFPSGNYEFMGFHKEGLPSAQICSLVSPAHEFAHQEEALSMANEVMHNLMQEAVVQEAASSQTLTAKRPALTADTLMTRRNFLRGAFLRG